MKKLKLNSLFGLCLIIASSMIFLQCKTDDDPQFNGRVQFEITDAPIDNAEVQGAFITISAIKVDGKDIGLENEITLDLLAYQNGNTKTLGLAELEPGSYLNISLVLNYEKDSEGNEPGCYILTTDNKKHKLNVNGNNSGEFIIAGSSFNVEGKSQTEIVIDFDLRKSIINDENNPESDYAFVTENEMKAALRAMLKTKTGVIKGKCTNTDAFAEQTIVYAYRKGDFVTASETEGNGESNVRFSNAVTSSLVDANGEFSLHFLEAGEYEIHFAAFEDSNNDGKYELKGFLQTSILGNLNLLSLEVESNTSITLDVSAIGILPL